MTDKEAYEATLSLYKYCKNHHGCDGCIFRCNSYCKTNRDARCNLFEGIDLAEVEMNYAAKLLGVKGQIYTISDRP